VLAVIGFLPLVAYGLVFSAAAKVLRDAFGVGLAVARPAPTHPACMGAATAEALPSAGR